MALLITMYRNIFMKLLLIYLNYGTFVSYHILLAKSRWLYKRNLIRHSWHEKSMTRAGLSIKFESWSVFEYSMGRAGLFMNGCRCPLLCNWWSCNKLSSYQSCSHWICSTPKCERVPSKCSTWFSPSSSSSLTRSSSTATAHSLSFVCWCLLTLLLLEK